MTNGTAAKRSSRVGEIDRTVRWATLLVVLAFAGLALASQGTDPAEPPTMFPATASSGDKGEEFPVPFNPLPKTITPCRACHGPEKDFKINWTRERSCACTPASDSTTEGLASGVWTATARRSETTCFP